MSHPNRSYNMEVRGTLTSMGYNHSSLYSDLIETKTYLEKLRAEQPRVAAHFDVWRDHRKSTIDTVDSLQKKIDAICVSCNVARGVGAAAGIAGLLSGFIGLVLEANDHESAEQFKDASKLCAGAGAAAIVTSSFLEAGLSQSAINEIKRVLKEDIELTKPLRNWIQFSHEIDSRCIQLFQCDIKSNTFSSVLKVSWHCIKLLESGSRSVQDLIRNLQCCKMEGIDDLTMEIADKVTHFFKGLLTSLELLQPMKEICQILQKNPRTFEFAQLGAQIYFKVSSHLQSRSITMLLSAAGLSLPDLGGSVLQRCSLNAITLASHVVTIILAVKNIQEGKSKYSEALDQVKFALISELIDINRQMGTRVQSLKMDGGDTFELHNSNLAIRYT